MKLQINNKEITIRKWKGKDKRNFVKSIGETADDGNSTETSILNSLVYSCIEEDVILSPEEFKFVISRIRSISLGETINYEFRCEECNHVHSLECKITDIIKDIQGNKKDTISTEGVEIKLGEIRNKDFYNTKVLEDESYDLILRIAEINGADTFTLDEVIDFLDDLDLDVLEDVLEQYDEIRFRVDDTNEVSCPECKFTESYKFDEMPGFLPETWFTNNSMFSK